jgi:predicted helicase
MKGDSMNKRDEIYSELRSIAQLHKIDFDIQFICCGRGVDCGELCIEYNDEEGYILFAYDRNLETYYYSTKDVDEFKYTVFRELCTNNGFKYELSNREQDEGTLKDRNDLRLDTRKIAFEYSLLQLNRVSSTWMERCIPEFERLLNIWRDETNVFFNRQTMKFDIK